MAPPADPYRTLGLGRDASLDQVKRAYRRLAKANHPDTAGEAAVPRFLAIKAAYEAIAGPDATDASRAGRAAGTSRRPWEADPDRADATRRAYGSRGRRAQPGPGSRPAGRPSAGRTRSEQTSSTSAPPPETEGPERPPNLATLGSTTYDGTEGQPFEPDWGGASWYGTTSGTYWTLNPKEYADPRKHGPEYQARARRARRQEVEAGAKGAPAGQGPAGDTGDAPAADTSAADTSEDDTRAAADSGAAEADAAAAHPGDSATDAATASTADATARGTRGSARASHTTASWWDATAGAGADDPIPDAGGHPAPRTARSTIPDAASTTAGARGAAPSPFRRIAPAVLGWLPIAFGIDAVAGAFAGCLPSTVGCVMPYGPMIVVLQVAVLAILVLVPLLARLAFGAAIAAGLAAIPAALVLGAAGQPPAAGEMPAPLAVVLLAAWASGVGIAGMRESRRPVS